MDRYDPHSDPELARPCKETPCRVESGRACCHDLVRYGYCTHAPLVTEEEPVEPVERIDLYPTLPAAARARLDAASSARQRSRQAWLDSAAGQAYVARIKARPRTPRPPR